jgi:thymidylate synthase (FAD)
MQLPIFLARQFVRHRTTSINEISGRYVQLPECWYIPEPEQVGVRPASVKQGRDVNLPNMHTGWFINQLNQACLFDYASYKSALNREIPPELARLFLHLNHYTRWLWKQDLHNMLHFFSLRLESHAQWEARQYGKALFQLLSNYLPKTLEFWAEENAHLALELS